MPESAPIERETMSRKALIARLDDLVTASAGRPGGDDGRFTVVLPPGASVSEVVGVKPSQIPDEMMAAAERSETGAVLFGSPSEGWVVLPPFPLQTSPLAAGWRAEALRALLTRELVLGVVLLRLEGFAVGVFQGDRLVDSRTGARWIHGRNRKGGQSQRRFERIREVHIQQLFGDTCQAAQDKFGPYGKQIDYVVLGGDRHNLQTFLKSCRYLDAFVPRILERVLSIVEPKRATLERLPYALWQSQVLHWRVPDQA